MTVIGKERAIFLFHLCSLFLTAAHALLTAAACSSQNFHIYQLSVAQCKFAMVT